MVENRGKKEEAVVHVRDARSEELDQVALLMRDAYQEYRASFPAELWEGYLRDIMDVRSRIGISNLIVAEHGRPEEGGRVVGAVTFYPDASQSERESLPTGWAGLRLLAVPPEARGMGIGRVLMDECIRRSRRLGVPTLGLHTTEMMSVARGMYERMGFVRVPEFDFHPAPQVVVMAYRLDL